VVDPVLVLVVPDELLEILLAEGGLAADADVELVRKVDVDGEEVQAGVRIGCLTGIPWLL